MDITFALAGKRQDPNDKEHQLLLASRIAAMLFGDKHLDSPPILLDDGSRINIYPVGNDTFLSLHDHHVLRGGEFRLTSRYASEETLKAIVTLLQNCF